MIAAEEEIQTLKRGRGEDFNCEGGDKVVGVCEVRV